MKMNKCENDNTIIENGTINGSNKIEDNVPIISNNYVRRRKCNENIQICEKKKKRESLRRISSILRKTESTRTIDEIKQLEGNADFVRQIAKRKQNIANTKDRILEKEDAPEIIEAKAKKLADVLSRAQHLVCYTGAGISTSARIPDYRGSQGIWTLLQQGKEIGQHDLTLAEPTFTHMALFELHRREILRYTLSQNCDGLHLRSGLPRKSLSEVHGNMFIEVCKHCKPNVEYWRLFDTTELTARFNHKTNRRCHFCFKPLIDTIVHFGERGNLKWPLNWDSACKNADKADVILCLGSSLKVLKKYSWLWSMDRPKMKRPKIYIVNLQWTPKDKNASLKINGKCDEVMKLVMDFMNIKVSAYNRLKDPIFAHASLLNAEEFHTVSQPMLKHHNEEDNNWKLSGTETTESDSVKMEHEEMEIKKENDNDVSENVVEIISNNNDITNSSASKVALNLEEKHLKIENDKNTQVDGKIGEYNALQKTERNTNEISESSESKSEDYKIEAYTLSNEQNIKNEKNKLNGIASQTNKSNLIDNNITFKDCINSTEKKVKLNINEAQIQPNALRSKFSSPTENDDHKQIVDIQYRFNQLMAIKQNAFILHHKSTTTAATENIMLNSLCETENHLSFNKAQLSTSSAFSDAFAMAAAQVAAIKANHQNEGTIFIESGLKNEHNIDEKDYYQSLINYYRAIEGVLPHWYDVNYAYSGLHSIIHPPPNEVDIWGSIIIPIFQLNRNVAECEFCFDNYAEDRCQFYRPSQEFVMKPKRPNGKLILCECCDVDDEHFRTENKTITGTAHRRDMIDFDEAGDTLDESKTNSDEDEIGKERIKRAKVDAVKETTKVQPGWYGKGYRKIVRKKKRRQYQFPTV